MAIRRKLGIFEARSGGKFKSRLCDGNDGAGKHASFTPPKRGRVSCLGYSGFRDDGTVPASTAGNPRSTTRTGSWGKTRNGWKKVKNTTTARRQSPAVRGEPTTV